MFSVHVIIHSIRIEMSTLLETLLKYKYKYLKNTFNTIKGFFNKMFLKQSVKHKRTSFFHFQRMIDLKFPKRESLCL